MHFKNVLFFSPEHSSLPLCLFMEQNYQICYLPFSLCVSSLTLHIHLTGSDPAIPFGSDSPLTKNTALEVEKQDDGRKIALGWDSGDPPLSLAIRITSGKSLTPFCCQPSTFHLFGLLNGTFPRICSLSLYVFIRCAG